MKKERINKNEFSSETPLWHFIILSVATYGIYELYWFYKNWKFLREYNQMKGISPIFRTLFSPIFVFSLASQIKKISKARGFSCRFPVIMSGLVYFLSTSLALLTNKPYSLIAFIIATLALAILVNPMNKICKEVEKGLSVKKFKWWQNYSDNFRYVAYRI